MNGDSISQLQKYRNVTMWMMRWIKIIFLFAVEDIGCSLRYKKKEKENKIIAS